MRQPGRRKGVQRAGKGVRDTLILTVRRLTKSHAKQPNVYAEDLAQTPAGLVTAALAPVRPHEPCSVDSVGGRVLVSSASLPSTVLSAPLV